MALADTVNVVLKLKMALLIGSEVILTVGLIERVAGLESSSLVVPFTDILARY